MNGRRARTARLLTGAAFLAFPLLPAAPQQAQACAVSYGYKPELRPGEGGPGVCTSATSLMGVLVVTSLTSTALAALAVRAYRRGTLAALEYCEDDEEDELAAYLDATGLVPRSRDHR